MLVECEIPPSVLLTTLNHFGVEYHHSPSNCEKVQVFVRFLEEFIRPIREGDRFTIRHLNLPATTDVLLTAIHFPSKLHWTASSQLSESIEFASSIRDAEEQIGHSRTILVGDFNMNPFEPGVVNANALHGVMSRHIAEKKGRVVQGKRYQFFYNPMWGLFGDATPGPPGTYYEARSEHMCLFWNMFDQVLIRPDLLHLFSKEDLEILTSDGETPFVSLHGFPNAEVASDHFPVFFRLQL